MTRLVAVVVIVVVVVESRGRRDVSDLYTAEIRRARRRDERYFQVAAK